MSRILFILLLPLIFVFIAVCFYQQKVRPKAEVFAGEEFAVLDDGSDGLFDY